MKNRQIHIVLTVLLGLTLLLVSRPVAAAKSYRAERFDVDLVLRTDGSLQVKETIVFRFDGGPFQGVFRDLALVETDGIQDIQASMDGQHLAPGTGPGQVEIQDGDPIKVTWHFSPVSDSTHRFELSYRALGVARKLDADTLIWRAIPETHEYAIDSSTVLLHWPAAAVLLSTPEVRGPTADVESSGQQAAITARGIAPDTSLIVTVRFQPGTLTDQMPGWQARQQARGRQTAGALPWGLAAGGLMLVVALLGLAGYLAQFRRRGAGRPDRSLRPVEPPASVPPALVARLTGQGQPSLAALFDLAGRGVFRIDETKHRWTGKHYTLHLEASDEPLRPHEQGLVQALFDTKKGRRDTIEMSEVGTRLSTHSRDFNRPLDEELRAAGWLDPVRKAARKRLLVAAALAIIGSPALLVLGAILGGVLAARGDASLILPAALVGAGIALFVAGFVALIAGASFSIWTEEGERQAAAWKGFRGYLKDVTRGREPAAGVEVFERYLPLAAGLGLATAWAAFFKKQVGVSVPTWFHSLDGSGDIGGVIAAITAADSSVSSGGDGGGAGASGGGASGAF